MTWDDICSIFEGVYVNWDPTLFRHRLEFHGYVVDELVTTVRLKQTPEFGKRKTRQTMIYVSAPSVQLSPLCSAELRYSVKSASALDGAVFLESE